MPDTAERDFLYRQQEGGLTHKDISLDPHSGELTGFVWQSAEQAERLRQILERFASSAQAWLGELLPGYARGWHADRVGFRPEEEATRRQRLSARNDLLHVDAFPSQTERRPAHPAAVRQHASDGAARVGDVGFVRRGAAPLRQRTEPHRQSMDVEAASGNFAALRPDRSKAIGVRCVHAAAAPIS